MTEPIEAELELIRERMESPDAEPTPEAIAELLALFPGWSLEDAESQDGPKIWLVREVSKDSEERIIDDGDEKFALVELLSELSGGLALRAEASSEEERHGKLRFGVEDISFDAVLDVVEIEHYLRENNLV